MPVSGFVQSEFLMIFSLCALSYIVTVAVRWPWLFASELTRIAPVSGGLLIDGFDSGRKDSNLVFSTWPWPRHLHHLCCIISWRKCLHQSPQYWRKERTSRGPQTLNSPRYFTAYYFPSWTLELAMDKDSHWQIFFHRDANTASESIGIQCSPDQPGPGFRQIPPVRVVFRTRDENSHAHARFSWYTVLEKNLCYMYSAER